MQSCEPTLMSLLGHTSLEQDSPFLVTYLNSLYQTSQSNHGVRDAASVKAEMLSFEHAEVSIGGHPF